MKKYTIYYEGNVEVLAEDEADAKVKFLDTPSWIILDKVSIREVMQSP